MSEFVTSVTVAAITGGCMVVAGYFNRVAIARKLDENHRQVNSRLTQLIRAKERIAHTKGMAEQRGLESKKRWK